MREVVALALVLTLVPLAAPAQTPVTPDPDLEQRIRQRRIIVQPRPSPDAVQRDTDQVIDDLSAQRRREQTLRELTPLPRRPDLSEPVQGGIQTRELNKALPR